MVTRARHICLIIFLVAFAIRAIGVLATHQYRDLERYEMERGAISLAHTGVLGNPYAVPTGPTAHLSPVYPVFLALIFKVFGTDQKAEIVKMLAASACTACCCALIPLIARRFGFDWRAAVLAGVLAALLPLKFRTETMGDWESPVAALALMMLLVVTANVWSHRDWSISAAALAGFVWGLGLLISYPTILLYWALVIVGFWVAGRAERVGYLRFALVQTLVAFVCLIPWAFRNYQQLGSPVFGRTNTGIELRISNNDLASANEQTNFQKGLYSVYHPLQSVGQAKLVRQLGEVQFNEMATRQAVDWIETHPGRFALLTLGRFGLFWFPVGGGVIKAVLLWVLTLLGWAGLMYIWNRQKIAGLIIAVTWLVLPLPNYLVHVGLKHSYPLNWTTTMLAAVTLVALYDRFTEPRRGSL